MRLSFPIIIGLLGHTIVGIVDNIMVGKLDPDNLAAVSLGNSFLFIAMSIGIGFSAAITPVVAEADSQNNLDRLRKIVTEASEQSNRINIPSIEGPTTLKNFLNKNQEKINLI